MDMYRCNSFVTCSVAGRRSKLESSVDAAALAWSLGYINYSPDSSSAKVWDCGLNEEADSLWQMVYAALAPSAWNTCTVHMSAVVPATVS